MDLQDVLIQTPKPIDISLPAILTVINEWAVHSPVVVASHSENKCSKVESDSTVV